MKIELTEVSSEMETTGRVGGCAWWLTQGCYEMLLED